MEVFPLNANVCVFVCVCVYIYFFDYKLITRSHAYTLTLMCVLIFESISNTALLVRLSSCRTDRCRNTEHQRQKTLAEKMEEKEKKTKQETQN